MLTFIRNKIVFLRMPKWIKDEQKFKNKQRLKTGKATLKQLNRLFNIEKKLCFLLNKYFSKEAKPEKFDSTFLLCVKPVFGHKDWIDFRWLKKLKLFLASRKPIVWIWRKSFCCCCCCCCLCVCVRQREREREREKKWEREREQRFDKFHLKDDLTNITQT